MGIQNWSTTAASNATQPNINWAEGMPPSDVNNSARAMMADLATWYAGPEWLVQSDAPTYVSATSFSVPSNRTAVFSTGRRVQATGTGYTITGAISSSTYTTLTTVNVVWDSGSLDNTVTQVAVGILQNQLAFLMPAGTIIDFGGSAAPSGFLSCDGSAISRTTYSRLFSAIGTTWGAGDGSTTFNLPNLQRKATIGAGGTAVSGPANTVGATGGEEKHTLATGELPAHNHGVSDPGHNHSVNDPGHSHNTSIYANATGGPNTGFIGPGSGTASLETFTSTTSFTGISLNAASTGITTTNTGSGTAFNVMQPSAVVLKCIKY